MANRTSHFSMIGRRRSGLFWTMAMKTWKCLWLVSMWTKLILSSMTKSVRSFVDLMNTSAVSIEPSIVIIWRWSLLLVLVKRVHRAVFETPRESARFSSILTETMVIFLFVRLDFFLLLVLVEEWFNRWFWMFDESTRWLLSLSLWMSFYCHFSARGTFARLFHCSPSFSKIHRLGLHFLSVYDGKFNYPVGRLVRTISLVQRFDLVV